MSAPVLASVASTLTHQVALHGVYAVFALMALDAIFPAGSEIVMLFAGALAAGVGSEKIAFPGLHPGAGLDAYLLLSASGTLGYLAGSALGWLIGYRGGRRLLARRGRWLHLSPERLGKAERWLTRWGFAGVFVGRVIPLVRSFLSIPAGVFRIAFVPYLILTALGSAAWCFGLAGAGWALGASYGRFDQAFVYAEYAVLAAVVVAVGLPLFGHLRASHSAGAK